MTSYTDPQDTATWKPFYFIIGRWSFRRHVRERATWEIDFVCDLREVVYLASSAVFRSFYLTIPREQDEDYCHDEDALLKGDV